MSLAVRSRASTASASRPLSPALGLAPRSPCACPASPRARGSASASCTLAGPSRSPPRLGFAAALCFSGGLCLLRWRLSRPPSLVSLSLVSLSLLPLLSLSLLLLSSELEELLEEESDPDDELSSEEDEESAHTPHRLAQSRCDA